MQNPAGTETQNGYSTKKIAMIERRKHRDIVLNCMICRVKFLEKIFLVRKMHDITTPNVVTINSNGLNKNNFGKKRKETVKLVQVKRKTKITCFIKST